MTTRYWCGDGEETGLAVAVIVPAGWNQWERGRATVGHRRRVGPGAGPAACPTARRDLGSAGQPALAVTRRTGGTVLALADVQLLSAGGLGWVLDGASPFGWCWYPVLVLGVRNLRRMSPLTTCLKSNSTAR